jgi:hypothetical protein
MHFINALDLWFDLHPSVSQRQLAIDADVPATDLSRIRAAKRSITLEALAKLLPAVERLSSRAHARTLLVAYLHDETPPAYEADVKIEAIDATGSLQRDAIAIARDRWEAKARSDAEFAKMWLTMDGYMHEADSESVDARVAAYTSPRTHAANTPTVAEHLDSAAATWAAQNPFPTPSEAVHSTLSLPRTDVGEPKR